MTVPLLVSVDSVEEARIAATFPIAIIDFKNPAAGALGRCCDAVLREVSHLSRPALGFSAACGELLDLLNGPDEGSSADDVDAGALPKGFRFLKAGPAQLEQAPALEYRMQRFAAACDQGVAPVAVAYADHEAAHALTPERIAELAIKLRFQWFLLDTMTKDGRSLIDWLSIERIKTLIDLCHQNRMRIVLAGSISLPLADQLLPLGPDLLGVRGAVCHTDRTSQIDPRKIEAWCTELRSSPSMGLRCEDS